ncbi:MAG TPA: type II secretion system protein [bacterium]|nr:type II secretion system protein [bacterium]
MNIPFKIMAKNIFFRCNQKVSGGFTLLEMTAAVVISLIGILGASYIVTNAYHDFKNSRELKALHEDIYLASHTIKSLIEEAGEFEITEIIPDTSPPAGRRINLKYIEDSETKWEKEFYEEEGHLILEDIKNGSEEIIIDTLEDISFSEGDSLNTLKVTISVTGMDGRVLTNKFLVYSRN